MSAPTLERDVPDHCEECGCRDLVEDTKNGDLVCPECGLVAASLLVDLGHEWRTFENDEAAADPNRIGGVMNPLLETGPTTSISNGPAMGNALNARLNKAQSRSAMSASDRYLSECFGRIGYLCERAGLPQLLKDRTCELFKMYYDRLTLNADGTRSRVRFREDETLAMVSGALFIACRNEGAPRTFNEVSALVRVARSRVAAYVKAIELSLGEAAKASRRRTTDDFVVRFASHLELPSLVMAAALQVARQARDIEGVHGRTHVSIAAGALHYVITLWREYWATHVAEQDKVPSASSLLARLTQVSGLSENVVRMVANRIRAGTPREEALLPPDWSQRLAASVRAVNADDTADGEVNGQSSSGVGGVASAAKRLRSQE